MNNEFNDEDFVLYQKGGDILSIGMKFDNIFRKHNLPAMIGGGNKGKTTSSLGLPIGLTFMNKHYDSDDDKDSILDNKVMNGGVIKNEIYNKLLMLAENRSSSNKKLENLKSNEKTRQGNLNKINYLINKFHVYLLNGKNM